MDEHGPAAGQEALDERRALGRWRARREHPAEPAPGLVRAQLLGVEEQAARPAPHHRRDLRRPDQAGERAVPGGQLVGLAEQREGGLRGLEPARHRRRLLGRQPGARGTEPGRDPHDEPREDRVQRSPVRAPHVAVAPGPGQRAERVHQLGHVGVDRRPGGEAGHQRLQRRRQVGQEAPLDGAGQLGQAGLLTGPLDGVGRGGRLDRGAVRAALHQPDGQLGLPAQPPRLPEGPRRATALDQLTPRHLEERQPVEQVRPGQLRRPAQVELQGPVLQLQAQAALGGREVPSERHHRRVVRHRAHRGADHEVVLDQRHGRRAAFAEHGGRGVGHLGQPGQGTAAQRRQRLGQAGGVDHLRRRRRVAAGPQHARHLAEPAGDDLWSAVAEQVVVPTGCADAGAVAARRGEAAARPRHPGHGHLGLGQSPQRGRVGGARRRPQRGDVPGPAHDRDPAEPVRDHCGQRSAHRRLPLQLPRPGRRAGLPDRGHRFLDRLEDVARAVLDQVVPPALDVPVAGRGRQLRQRVAHGSGRPPRPDRPASARPGDR